MVDRNDPKMPKTNVFPIFKELEGCILEITDQ